MFILEYMQENKYYQLKLNTLVNLNSSHEKKGFCDIEIIYALFNL